MASPDPSPGGERSGAVGLVREMPGPWDLATPSFHAVTDNYTGPALLPCCSKSGYPCYRVPTVAPGPTLGEVRTHRWGHFCDLALYSLKLLSAGVLTGFDYPSGWLLPHHIATAY